MPFKHKHINTDLISATIIRPSVGLLVHFRHIHDRGTYRVGDTRSGYIRQHPVKWTGVETAVYLERKLGRDRGVDCTQVRIDLCKVKFQTKSLPLRQALPTNEEWRFMLSISERNRQNHSKHQTPVIYIFQWTTCLTTKTALNNCVKLQ